MKNQKSIWIYLWIVIAVTACNFPEEELSKNHSGGGSSGNTSKIVNPKEGALEEQGRLAEEENNSEDGLLTEEMMLQNPQARYVRPKPVPLSKKYEVNVRGDYVAKGIGLRNAGSGDIDIHIPQGAKLVKAFLYYSVMSSRNIPDLAAIKVNGTGLSAQLSGSTSSPCWSASKIYNFKADISRLFVDGKNHVYLPSGRRGLVQEKAFPYPYTHPLLEGATIIAVFEHPEFDLKHVQIQDGAVTFYFPPAVTTKLSGFKVPTSDAAAKTTFIVADGQQNHLRLNNKLYVNGTMIAEHAVNGDGPGTQLWDTRTEDITPHLKVGDTTLTVGIESSSDGYIYDCLTWVAQAFSITLQVNVALDIKPTSCPNPINFKSKGVLPAAILGSSVLNVKDIIVSSILLEGVAPIRSSFEDVSTPFLPIVGKLDRLDCTTLGSDGQLDLTLKFDKQSIVQKLQGALDGERRVLKISGLILKEGKQIPFHGEDVVVIINKKKK